MKRLEVAQEPAEHRGEGITGRTSGNLYFAPVQILFDGPITSYPLPDSF